MAIYTVPENVAISDSGFLFLASTGESFTLNETGKEMFKMLQQNFNRDEILAKIQNDFDTEAITLDRDFEEFISQLKSYGLIKSV
ncbi:MAG: PqqD family protein [Ignavibacteriales bacterium]|nr:PqqD family protein [Ignavibacteriales bacterium]